MKYVMFVWVLQRGSMNILYNAIYLSGIVYQKCGLNLFDVLVSDLARWSILISSAPLFSLCLLLNLVPCFKHRNWLTIIHCCNHHHIHIHARPCCIACLVRMLLTTQSSLLTFWLLVMPFTPTFNTVNDFRLFTAVPNPNYSTHTYTHHFVCSHFLFLPFLNCLSHVFSSSHSHTVLNTVNGHLIHWCAHHCLPHTRPRNSYFRIHPNVVDYSWSSSHHARSLFPTPWMISVHSLLCSTSLPPHMTPISLISSLVCSPLLYITVHSLPPSNYHSLFLAV